MKNFTTLLVFILLMFLGGCMGRSPNPINSHQYGDFKRSFRGIKAEIAMNEAEIVKKREHDDSKLITNALWYLSLTPWAMDLKQAEVIEVEALEQRNKALRLLLIEKEEAAIRQEKRDKVLSAEKKIMGNKKYKYSTLYK